MKTIAEKLQALTAKEIIMAMVNGLRNPHTKIGMYTYGHKENGVCFGCAATQTLCELGLFKPDQLSNGAAWDAGFSQVVETVEDMMAVSSFEAAIDDLRRGLVGLYNAYSRFLFAKIKDKPGLKLPHLDDDYTEEDLLKYVELANYQKS